MKIHLQLMMEVLPRMRAWLIHLLHNTLARASMMKILCGTVIQLMTAMILLTELLYYPKQNGRELE